MSVQSQIDRLNSIKQRIRTNLVAQGITVPEDTKLEAMAEQILSVAGEDGYTPVRGVDYYTEADKAEFSTYIATELAKRGQLAPEYANSIEECTDTTKMYVLPDGFIYAYMLTEIETGPSYKNWLTYSVNQDGSDYKGDNGEDGYRKGYRWSASSKVEKAATKYDCIGYIPVKANDIIRIANVGDISPSTDGPMYATAYFYKSSFVQQEGATYLSNKDNQLISVENGVYTFAVPNNSTINWMKLTLMGVTADTIITINEEITEGGGTATGYAWANTGHAFVPADYEERIVDLEKQTAKHTTDIENLKTGAVNVTDITKWDAPIYDANIPVFQLSTEKAAMTNAACAPADIYARYDALMAKHPQYITKTDLGLCSDGVNHVYRYDFREPDSRHTSGYRWSETKAKAIIVSGIHYEWSGIYGLYYALEEIADNPALYELRRNSHLIVVPCMNPYATIEGNYSNSKGVKNANGVEIHRNFEVGWTLTDSEDLHYGGAEPLSEVETQYVDTIMRENADAALFLTCHSFADTSFNFIWPSTATPYMCNMGYRLIDKLSNVWMEKHGSALVGLEDYRTEDIPSWDNRLGFAHISMTPGTETRQGTKYGIQSANVEINGRFWVHGTKASPEPSMSAFTMSRGAEVYVNFLLTVFGTYDPKDKALYS